MNVQTLKEWILMALCVTEWASVRPGPQSKPAHRDWPAAQTCRFNGFSGTMFCGCADFKGMNFSGAVRHRGSVRPGPQPKPCHTDFGLQLKSAILMVSLDVQTLKEWVSSAGCCGTVEHSTFVVRSAPIIFTGPCSPSTSRRSCGTETRRCFSLSRELAAGRTKLTFQRPVSSKVHIWWC